jgi:hypothetical protein
VGGNRHGRGQQFDEDHLVVMHRECFQRLRRALRGRGDDVQHDRRKMIDIK